jgi:hypothetical protein
VVAQSHFWVDILLREPIEEDSSWNIKGDRKRLARSDHIRGHCPKT